MSEAINKLGKQRATIEASARAASKLIGLVDEPLSPAEVVRRMTGGHYYDTTRKMHEASRGLEVAEVELQRAIDALRLRLQEYSEAVDQEFERLMP
jgi:hypothetical protein